MIPKAILGHGYYNTNDCTFCKDLWTPFMQPLRHLGETLRMLANREHCIFASSDLAAAVPEYGQLAVLLSRAAKAGLLRRVCKGIYLYPGFAVFRDVDGKRPS